jgi:hypothetical protein
MKSPLSEDVEKALILRLEKYDVKNRFVSNFLQLINGLMVRYHCVQF